jgi:uncharacterized Zn finger protein (UPF0148 family)
MKTPCPICAAPLEQDCGELVCPACGNIPEISPCCNEIMDYEPIEGCYICGCGKRVRNE